MRCVLTELARCFDRSIFISDMFNYGVRVTTLLVPLVTSRQIHRMTPNNVLDV